VSALRVVRGGATFLAWHRSGPGWFGRVVFPLLAGLLIYGGAGRAARAGVEGPMVAIEVTNCPLPWDAEIRRAVAVELGDERLASAPMVRAEDKQLRITCIEQAVRVQVRDGATAALLERTFAAGELPVATAPRLVALAGVELLATLDPALRRRRAAASASGSRGLSGAELTRSEIHPLSLTANAVYRAFLSSGGIHAWGGALDALRAPGKGRWLLGAGVEIAGADARANLGRTSALLASARASAGMRVRVVGDWMAVAFAVGARVGAVRLAGHSDAPTVLSSTVIRPWGGPVASATTELGVSRFCAQITLEGGWAAVAASGIVSEAPVLAASGPWVAIGLGVGIRR